MEATTIATQTSATELTEEDVWLKIMEQNLEGVMFHSYEEDLFTLLDLKGFRKMHKCQVEEESENLGNIKKKYIDLYKKMPVLESQGFDKWKMYDESELSHEKIAAMVKESMEDYAHWETEVLEHLLKWKRNTKDRKLVHSMIEDVMKELKYIENIMDVLEEHEYNYECISEMSDYLYQVY
jgi:hypothetical protein